MVCLDDRQIGDFLGDIGRGAEDEAWHVSIREEFMRGMSLFSVFRPLSSALSSLFSLLCPLTSLFSRMFSVLFL
jgi:hypothetical protein